MLERIELLPPLSCTRDESAQEVAKKLRQSVQRHIYVTDDKGTPLGIISTTDINNKVVAEGKNVNEAKAEEIMVRTIETYDVQQDAFEVYKEMMANKRLACAVVKENKLIGVVTVSRLVNHLSGGQ